MASTNENICRGCLLENGSTLMFPFNDNNLRELFTACTTVSTRADDKHPQKLCGICRNKCLRWQAFKSQALEVERKLLFNYVVLKGDPKKTTTATVSTPKAAPEAVAAEPKPKAKPGKTKWEGEFAKWSRKNEEKSTKEFVPKLSPPIAAAAESPTVEPPKEGNETAEPKAVVTVKEEEDPEESNNMVEIMNITTDARTEDESESDVQQPKRNVKRARKPYVEPPPRPKRSTPSVYKFPGSSKSTTQDLGQEHDSDDEDFKPSASVYRKSTSSAAAAAPTPPPSKSAKSSPIKRSKGTFKSLANKPSPKPYPLKKLKKPVKTFKEMPYVQRRHPTLPIQCHLCNGAFTLFALFQQHFEEEHENEVTFGQQPVKGQRKVCPTCDEQIAPSITLLHHTLVNHMTEQFTVKQVRSSDMKFQCKECGSSYARSSNLLKHMQEHKLRQLGSVPCLSCERSFPTVDEWDHHRKTMHNPHRPIKCEFCEMSFQVQSQLRDHLRTHTGEKPYACNLCGRRFNVKSNCNRHMAVHKVQVGKNKKTAQLRNEVSQSEEEDDDDELEVDGEGEENIPVVTVKMDAAPPPATTTAVTTATASATAAVVAAPKKIVPIILAEKQQPVAQNPKLTMTYASLLKRKAPEELPVSIATPPKIVKESRPAIAGQSQPNAQSPAVTKDVTITYGSPRELAQMLKKSVESKFGHQRITVTPIGTVVPATGSSGPTPEMMFVERKPINQGKMPMGVKMTAVPKLPVVAGGGGGGKMAQSMAKPMQFSLIKKTMGQTLEVKKIATPPSSGGNSPAVPATGSAAAAASPKILNYSMVGKKAQTKKKQPMKTAVSIPLSELKKKLEKQLQESANNDPDPNDRYLNSLLTRIPDHLK